MSSTILAQFLLTCWYVFLLLFFPIHDNLSSKTQFLKKNIYYLFYLRIILENKYTRLFHQLIFTELQVYVNHMLGTKDR